VSATASESKLSLIAIPSRRKPARGIVSFAADKPSIATVKGIGLKDTP